jgi:hypothetical protein
MSNSLKLENFWLSMEKTTFEKNLHVRIPRIDVFETRAILYGQFGQGVNVDFEKKGYRNTFLN